MSKLNQFDGIAFIYDKLASIALLGAIRKSQRAFIDKLTPDAHLLILGGGTGWILEEILQNRPNAKICYVEASEKMIERSKRHGGAYDVRFIHGTEDDIPVGNRFDAIITNYYLDIFDESQLDIVVSKIRSFLKENGTWIVADFCDDKVWMRVYLKLMYIFFNVTCGLRTVELPPWREIMKKFNLRELESRKFFRGFIKSAVYAKEN